MTQFIEISIEEEQKKNTDLKKSDIDELKEWMNTQPHLPDISDSELVIFLHASFYHVESTKTLIDSYFTMRAHMPEFFADRDPVENEDFRKIFDVVSAIPLKHMSKDGYHVILLRVSDPDASKFVLNNYVKFVALAIEIFSYSVGIMKGLILLYDVQHLSMRHVPRVNLISVKKCMNYMQNSAPTRFKGFYFINANRAMKFIMSMIKPFMKAELGEMIQIYSTLEDLDKVIPVEALPNELGGKAGPIIQLHEAEIKKFESNRDWILEQDSRVRVDESK